MGRGFCLPCRQRLACARFLLEKTSSSLRTKCIMQYDKSDRQSIKDLSETASRLFQALEREEQGEFSGSGVSDLCTALDRGPQFIAFSCLSGNARKLELGNDLGVLFTTKLKHKAERFVRILRSAGYTSPFTVIVDDYEPWKVWEWDISPQDVTDWYRMAVEDSDIPSGWEVKLWSDFVRGDTPGSSAYIDYKTVPAVNGICLYELYKHMRRFPNKKLKMDVRQAAERRARHYQVQGLELSNLIEGPILVQTETPWEVKDPLYITDGSFLAGSWKRMRLPIIHPF